MMCARSVMRSRSALHSRAFGMTCVHLENGRFVVSSTTACSARSAITWNKNSAPSGLKITDMRACTVAANYDYPIIRIDTNQGVYGLGEVFAAGVRGSALMLKAYLVGKDPLQISSILRSIRNSAGQNFWNTGYGAIDLALHDIGCGARVADAHEDDRRLDVGVFVDLQLEQRRDTERDERQHRHDGDDRPLDGKIGDEHGGSLTPD